MERARQTVGTLFVFEHLVPAGGVVWEGWKELLRDGAFQGEAVTRGGPWGFLACPISCSLCFLSVGAL